jgi:hypothetical protein
MRGESKYSSLLGDAQVRRWHANLARGSPVTAEVALRRLGKLCEVLGLNPKQMVAGARRDLAGFQDAVEDVDSSPLHIQELSFQHRGRF